MPEKIQYTFRNMIMYCQGEVKEKVLFGTRLVSSPIRNLAADNWRKYIEGQILKKKIPVYNGIVIRECLY